MILIDREKALSHPFANGQYDRKNANRDFIRGFESYKEWLEDLPTIDIVTCGECKHGIKHPIEDVECGLTSIFMSNTDFCSYGERPNADQRTQRVESVEEKQEEWLDFREEQEYNDRWGKE